MLRTRMILLFCLLTILRSDDVSSASSLFLPSRTSSTLWKFSSSLKLMEKSLERATQFYEKNYDKVNLDSIFGLRAAEGIIIIVDE